MWPFGKKKRLEQDEVLKGISDRTAQAQAIPDAAERYDALRTLHEEVHDISEGHSRKHGKKLKNKTIGTCIALVPAGGVAIMDGLLMSQGSSLAAQFATVPFDVAVGTTSASIISAMPISLAGLISNVLLRSRWLKKNPYLKKLNEAEYQLSCESRKILDEQFPDMAASPSFDKVREKYRDVNLKYSHEIRYQLQISGGTQRLDNLTREFEEKAKAAITGLAKPPPPATMLKLG